MSAPSPQCQHAMTIDVEDYYHVSAFERVITPNDWADLPSRVEQNTRQLLTLFASHEVKATFFVLGWVAERYPELVREIAAAGHEIASHGFSHQLVYQQTPAVFRQETERSKKLLEDLSGQPISGYRAASYSITAKSLWALDILAELGFRWDSSIFPVRHDRYGMPDTPTHPYRLQTAQGNSLIEYPLTTARLLGMTLPAAGGGYFRLYPYWLSRFLFNRASNHSQQPAIFYLHPWEIDPEQPRFDNASWLSRFRHYNNLEHCQGRLEQLMRDFRFTTVGNSLSNQPLPTVQF